MSICVSSRFLHYSCLFIFLTSFSALAFGQGAKMRSEYESVADQDRDQPQARDQWFMRGRLIPGELAAALRYRAHQQKMQARAARIAAAQSAGLDTLSQTSGIASGWIALGPAPLASDASGFGQQDYNWVSGRATAVAVDAADLTGNTVYVGGAYGGVWKSTNAGPLSLTASSVTWTPVIDNQATLAVGAITIQPQLTNPDPTKSVILAGTGETNSSGDSYYGLGILRSADAGQTWTLITKDSTGTRNFAGLGFSKIAFSTSNPNLVVAAAAGATTGDTEGLENPVTLNRGLYYSQDGGVSWTFATIKDGSTVIAPGSATSVIFDANAGATGTFLAAMRFHGIYSSTDGINWTRLATQPGTGLTTLACPANPSSQNCPIYRGEFAVVPGRNEMYVWYVDANEVDKGIYRSTNSGTSWTTLNESGIAACGDSFGCGTSQGVYNLELAAVPNGGTATDLYAGAINIYKCSFANNASTSCTQPSWLNLTHVYGCSSIAKVHPDQHDLDFMVANGKDIMYFANDGGIYRALDGYTDLTTGTCGLSNQFDSLNQTLGSMTQFVSFSESPTDANTILGGTQDNGSPATASSQSSTSWLNVNAGDGGYNAINPSSSNEWFTANTDVSIQRCTAGIACHTGDFLSVVNPINVGGDHGAFYTPYILDPQVTASELIVGTCRVWRGPGTGGINLTQLSVNFETLSPTGGCTGSEVNLVRSLAAGGPKDGSGFSNVIYAGTDSFGPGTSPPGGHIWVTTNAAGGTSTWMNRTGSINSGNFALSGVAVDNSDATGQTAYVTIMGFHVSHVWKTTNAGTTWTDFGGITPGTGLPDAPANAVIVDPGPTPTTGTVYVATDVGVFSASTGSTPPVAWTEVGPAPSSMQNGYLPNVAVTALRIFNSGGTKKLRASTYGRGVWEFNLVTTPDFQIGFSTSTQTIFPTQSATYNGTLTALNGYTDQVALSCTGTVPSTCTLNPTTVTPLVPPGALFTLTADGAVGDYAFNAHAVGSDINATTHDAALTLHVVDFNLTAPQPGSITVNRPNTSDPISFQVTALGSFSGTVTLSCSGLPAGAACNFSPSSSVNPTSSTPVTVTLTISTTTSTSTGTFPVTISANTAGAPAAKTQNLSLTVTALADYTLVVSNPSLSATAGGQATFNGTLTAFNGYSSLVNVNCGAGAPPTCPPTSVTPSAGGAAFTVTVSSSVVQNYNFSIAGVGTDPSTIAHAMAVSFNSTFDFQITNNTSTQTVTAGTPAMYNLDVMPVGSNFPSNVILSCSGLPLHSSCSFNPTQVTAGSGDTPVTLTISTMSRMASVSHGSAIFYAVWMPLPGLVLAFGGLQRRGRRGKRVVLLLVALVLLLVGLQACGGGGSGSSGGGQPGTPIGDYAITVTATSTSGSLTHSTQVMLDVR
ncbi:MAG: hypothetical protein LAN63_16965 [Acidobacteriia bacterium]|nr:hypothetical protein [Terriglobia bacterium]